MTEHTIFFNFINSSVSAVNEHWHQIVSNSLGHILSLDASDLHSSSMRVACMDTMEIRVANSKTSTFHVLEKKKQKRKKKESRALRALYFCSFGRIVCYLVWRHKGCVIPLSTAAARFLKEIKFNLFCSLNSIRRNVGHEIPYKTGRVNWTPSLWILVKATYTHTHIHKHKGLPYLREH